MKGLFFILLSALGTLRATTSLDNDPLFRIKPSQAPQGKNGRELGVLDWFSSDPDKEASKKREKNVKDMMELLQLADGFHSNDNFEVEVDINYKSSDPSPTPQTENRVLNQQPVRPQQKVTRKLNKDEDDFDLDEVDKEYDNETPTAQILREKRFQIPKNFFRVL